MHRHFVTKNKKKTLLHKIIFYMILILVTFYLTLSLIATIHKKNDKMSMNVLDNGLSNVKIVGVNLLSIKTLLALGLNATSDSISSSLIKSTIIDSETHMNSSKPSIYIYNTHPNNSYDTKVLNAYNISYTVKTSSFILREKLYDYGIKVLVDDSTIDSTYKEKRKDLIEKKNTYDTLKYYIELDRDIVSSTLTTTTIDGKDYAKVLFVIGRDNKNYKENLRFATQIESRLDKRLSRGIIKKRGNLVDGVYNQDLDKNMTMILIGGIDNDIIEVENTINTLARAIYDVIKEQ